MPLRSKGLRILTVSGESGGCGFWPIEVQNPPERHRGRSLHAFRKKEGPPGRRSQRGEKLLPPPFMGEVARWIRAKPGAAGSEGVPTFQRKVGISEYLLRKYSDSPRPSGTPLINAGGKNRCSLTV